MDFSQKSASMNRAGERGGSKFPRDNMPMKRGMSGDMDQKKVADMGIDCKKGGEGYGMRREDRREREKD